MEPSPVRIVPFANDQYVLITQPDWALMMGYVYELQGWIRSAGPCLRRLGSDIANAPGGVP